MIAGATGYGVWPENTLEGALRCLAAPVDGIEIDALLTEDRHVVAHHDYRLNRDQTRLDGAWLEGESPPLKQLRLDELRRFDVGRSRPGSRPARRYPAREHMDGVGIPTLPDLLAALAAADGPRPLIYVEIKTDPTAPDIAPAPETIVDAVLRDLVAADYVEHAKIIAFDWQVLRLSLARTPEIRTAHLTAPQAFPTPWTDGLDIAGHGGSPLRAIKGHGGTEWSPHFTEVTAERMAEARDLDLKVGPWGLSLGEDIRRMAGFGVYSSTVSGPDWGL
jgi:glycerophosphoryl diester phosphodiesterase